jgi:hypothetical protein
MFYSITMLLQRRKEQTADHLIIRDELIVIVDLQTRSADGSRTCSWLKKLDNHSNSG